MFDEHLDRQVRLTYSVRGPEWAFALPADDMDALREVMKTCSTFWNGAGSLLVPVKDDGSVWPQLNSFLAVTPVDRIWLHPRLSQRARDAIIETHPHARDLTPDFDRREFHPLDLQPFRDPGEPRATLMVPNFDDGRLATVALVCWGWIPEADRPEWSRSFGVLDVHEDTALRSIVEAQTGTIATSPLGATTVGQRIINHVNPHEFPYLFFLDDDFDDLVLFWNVR